MKLLETLRRRRSPQGAGPDLSARREAEVALAAKPSGAGVQSQEHARERCLEGDRLLAQGSAADALRAYQDAIDLAVDACIDGHLGQARAYLMQNRAEDAADSLEVALALEPDLVSALHMLARIRSRAGEEAAAIALLRKAAGVAPERSDILLELGLALNRHGETTRAIEVYAQAIQAAPHDPGPRVNLGLIHLQQLGEPHAAEAYFRAALAIAPAHVEAAANLGLALHDQGRYDEAFEVYARGEQQHPACSEFRWNRALGHLALGHYAEGWDDYELRFSRPGGRNLGRFRYPEWDGTAVTNARVLVLAEQGLGDEIMFASCLGDLAAMSEGVVLECAPRLAELFRRSFASVAVHGVDRQADLDWLEPYPDIVAKAAIGSLPRRLRRSAQAFTPHKGYLRADPQQVRSYRDRLKQLGAAVTVGISWRAGTRATRGALRSADLEVLRPLLAVPNVRFVCLQHGMDEAERAHVRELGLHVWEEALADLDAGAALISALDLVITVANTNAHLSGALGHPTWVLLNESPEWRWLRAVERSPWYPSALLFRPGQGHEWGPMVTEVAERLCALAAAPVPQLGRFGCGGAP